MGYGSIGSYHWDDFILCLKTIQIQDNEEEVSLKAGASCSKIRLLQGSVYD